MSRGRDYPLGASVTLEQLENDPHPLLARLREHEPVSWVPVLDGWLVTRHDLCAGVMRDATTFTVQDERFSTSQVIGPSMLSLDGEEHARHRAPFVGPFRPNSVSEQFTGLVAEEAQRLLDALEPLGGAELRRAFAGPLAASIIARALGLRGTEVDEVLSWYDAIVVAVTELTAGHDIPAAGQQAFRGLGMRLRPVIASASAPASGAHGSLLAGATRTSTLTDDELVSNAAVLLFGGIETTEAMIANVVLHLLQHPNALARVRDDPQLIGRALEESLRLEPAAAIVDRYATADTCLAGANISRGELVHVSITGANRDPAVFADPDRLELSRTNARAHLAFAHGPHVCLGVHLARLEARTALAMLLRRLPTLALDPSRPSPIRGLVFRKPPALHVVWS